MIEKNYYSLRLVGTNAFHEDGDVLKTTNKVLHIGETADCGIKFESGKYEPERYASIVENEDGKSWRLIQRSEHVNAQIAGSGGFGYVHELQDGDVISFDGQNLELEFHTHYDGNYGKEGFVIEHVAIEKTSNTKPLYWWICGLTLISLLFAGFFLKSHLKDISYDDLKRSFENSVYLIKVDSVQWIGVYHGDTTLIKPTMNGGGIVGTAFLTKDRKLITARHCIEYWIGDDIDDIQKLRETNDVRKWAILSETFSYLHEGMDSVQMLRVFFSIHTQNEADKTVFTFTSTDSCVHINRFYDARLEFGDYDNVYYWRSIKPKPEDPERELGDIASIDVDKVGAIELADSAIIASLNQSSKLGILGLPGNLTGRQLKFAPGRMTENRSDTTIVPNPNLQFEASIAKGFSGGPVFVRARSGKIVVAGVVSKIDTDNGTYRKAVPVTEIANMMRKERESKND